MDKVARLPDQNILLWASFPGFSTNRAATFLLRAVGHSTHEASIFAGDLLMVGHSVPPRSGSIVVVAVDGEYPVKRLKREHGLVSLEAVNPDYPPIE